MIIVRIIMIILMSIIIDFSMRYLPVTATVALWLRRPLHEREVVGSILGRVIPKTKLAF